MQLQQQTWLLMLMHTSCWQHSERCRLNNSSRCLNSHAHTTLQHHHQGSYQPNSPAHLMHSMLLDSSSHWQRTISQPQPNSHRQCRSMLKAATLQQCPSLMAQCPPTSLSGVCAFCCFRFSTLETSWPHACALALVYVLLCAAAMRRPQGATRPTPSTSSLSGWASRRGTTTGPPTSPRRAC